MISNNIFKSLSPPYAKWSVISTSKNLLTYIITSQIVPKIISLTITNPSGIKIFFLYGESFRIVWVVGWINKWKDQESNTLLLCCIHVIMREYINIHKFPLLMTQGRIRCESRNSLFIDFLERKKGYYSLVSSRKIVDHW